MSKTENGEGANETGPLFVAVRFVGWQYMLGNYSVEVTEDD